MSSSYRLSFEGGAISKPPSQYPLSLDLFSTQRLFCFYEASTLRVVQTLHREDSSRRSFTHFSVHLFSCFNTIFEICRRPLNDEITILPLPIRSENIIIIGSVFKTR
jgi:hypothetical protein